MIDLLVTWMEMRAPPVGVASFAPLDGAAVVAERLSREDYLQLYRAIGGPLKWDQRLKLADHELELLLASPKSEVYVLRLHDRPVGICEFEQKNAAEIELKNFGLIEAAQGQRLGPFLLDRALRGIWKRAPSRLFLHTDEWDHPAAQRTYLRAGFTIYDQRRQDATDL